MKARIVLTISDFAGGRANLGAVSSTAAAYVLQDADNRQWSEPVRALGALERETGKANLDDALVFAYRNRVVVVDPPFDTSFDEILVAVRHVVLSHEREFADMRSDIERFLRFPEGAATPREPIPREVRMFVWQRDEGCCVQCRSIERLEYDHIIALANGGSNTERNIQLLCEKCNRSKGTALW